MSTYVGKLTDFPPGSIKPRQIEGRQLLIANAEGQLYAFKDECPHAQQPLATGYLRGSELVCIYHWAIFNLASKAVVQGPATKPVQTFEISISDEKVFVSL